MPTDEWAAFNARRAPTDKEWAIAERPYTPGTVVIGAVLSHHAVGYFVDLGEPITGLVVIPFVREEGESITPADYPAVGSQVEAVVFDAHPLQRQVRLNARPSDIARARCPDPGP